MKPEQRLARRLVVEKQLTPPVDIQGIIQEFAEIEVATLPLDCDAVALRTHKRGERPRIILDPGKPPRRRRFTLAHELGHLLIPWHVGTIACHTGWDLAVWDEFYRTTEAEANRFASELLLPSEWLRQIVDESTSLGESIRSAKRAQVSTLALSFAMVSALPAGYAFLVTDSTNSVARSVASAGTVTHLPTAGVADISYYKELASEYIRLTSGPDVFHWFRLDAETEMPSHEMGCDSKTLLREIISAVARDAKERSTLTFKINGIIGSANSKYGSSDPGRLFNICRHRFASRAELLKCIRHPKFTAFLSARAREIADRRRS